MSQPPCVKRVPTTPDLTVDHVADPPFDDARLAFNQGRFAFQRTSPEERVFRLWHGAKSQAEVWARMDAAEPGDALSAWGFFVRVDKRHLRPAQLNAWRQVTDELGDAAVAALAEHRPPPSSSAIHHLQSVREVSPAADALLQQCENLPSWVDWDRVARGQGAWPPCQGWRLSAVSHDAPQPCPPLRYCHHPQTYSGVICPVSRWHY